MRLLIQRDAKYAKQINADLLSSKSFLLSVIGGYPEILRDVFARMFQDEAFVLSLIKANYVCLKYLPQRFCCDYRLCFEAAREILTLDNKGGI